MAGLGRPGSSGRLLNRSMNHLIDQFERLSRLSDRLKVSRILLNLITYEKDKSFDDFLSDVDSCDEDESTTCYLLLLDFALSYV